MSDTGKAVFLSYASQDAEAAKRICEALRASGVEVWFDTDGGLEHGDEWDRKIRGQIKDCVLFIRCGSDTPKLASAWSAERDVVWIAWGSIKFAEVLSNAPGLAPGIFTPIISANTQARHEGYFRIEWELAAERAMGIASGVAFILPIVIDDTREPEALVPDRFRKVQWTRLPGGNVPPDVKARFLKLWSHRTGVLNHEAARTTGSAPSPSQQPKSRAGLYTVASVTLALFAGAGWWLTHRSASSATSEAAKTAAVISEARQLVAKAWEQMNKPELARAELEIADGLCKRATELDPNDAEAWAAWSQADSWYLYHNFDSAPARRESARTKAARALQLAPGSYEASLAQACYLVRGGGGGGGGLSASMFEAEAESLLRALLLKKSDEPRALLALGILLRNTGKPAEARVVYERMAKSPAFAAQAWDELGWAEYFNNDYRAAETAADTSIALQPYWGNLILKVWIAQHWRGDLDLAKAALERIPVAVQQEDFGVSQAVELFYWRREPEVMLGILAGVPRDWLRSNGFDGPKAYFAALAQQMAGHGEAARLQWQKALKLVEGRLADQPDSGNLLHWKGLLLAGAGDRAEGETVLRLARDLGNKNSPIADATDQILLGNLDAALTLLEKAVAERSRGATAAMYRLNPMWDPLRELPRFKALQARLDADPHSSPKAKLATSEKTEDREQKSAPPSVDQKSVAVLAFANLSDDKGNEYFSDGISEELLNVLAKIPGLKVSARTSAFYFKGKEVPIPEIAQKLGVAYVVEGSVRKQGDKVRITAQLIKAADGFHVWSDTFTRNLKDIFAVQDEIAGLIAKNLQAKLEAPGGAPRFVDPEAHRLYLQGKFFLNQFSVESAHRAIDALQSAVQLDPHFAPAWAALGQAGVVLNGYGSTRADFDEGKAVARRAAARALAEAPDLVQAHLIEARVQLDDYDWTGASATLGRATALAPNDAGVVHLAGKIAYALGRREQARQLAAQAVELDPVNPEVLTDHGFVLHALRRFDEAAGEFRRIGEINANSPYGHAGVSLGLSAQRRFDEAAREAAQEVNEWSRLYGLAIAQWGQGRNAESDATVARLADKFGDIAAYQVAGVYATRGDKDRAFAWLERAYRQKDSGLSWLRSDLEFEGLYADPRWDAFLHKMGLAEEQLK